MSEDIFGKIQKNEGILIQCLKLDYYRPHGSIIVLVCADGMVQRMCEASLIILPMGRKGEQEGMEETLTSPKTCPVSTLGSENNWYKLDLE